MAALHELIEQLPGAHSPHNAQISNNQAVGYSAPF
jgi:hypothetical protein